MSDVKEERERLERLKEDLARQVQANLPTTRKFLAACKRCFDEDPVFVTTLLEQAHAYHVSIAGETESFLKEALGAAQVKLVRLMGGVCEPC